MPSTELNQRQIQKLRSRHGRKKLGLSICEGRRCCHEFLTRKPEWGRVAIFDDQTNDSDLQDLQLKCRNQNIPVKTVPEREFNRLSQTEHPQGVLIVFDPSYGQESHTVQDPFILILDQVQDPGNTGTILRSASAAALREVWVTSGTADLFAPKAIRAGMGAQFSIMIRSYRNLDNACSAATEHGYDHVWLTAMTGEMSCFDPDFDIYGSTLVIGNEGRGISAAPASGNVQTVHIPMPGCAESLNVAQATTVLLFDAVRRGLLPPSERPE